MADSHEQAGLLGFGAKTDLKSTPSGPLDPDLLPDFPALGEHLHGPGLLVTVFIGPETVDPCRRHAGGCHARLGTRPRQNQAPAQAD